jgi:hypothetical protein
MGYRQGAGAKKGELTPELNQGPVGRCVLLICGEASDTGDVFVGDWISAVLRAAERRFCCSVNSIDLNGDADAIFQEIIVGGSAYMLRVVVCHGPAGGSAAGRILLGPGERPNR